MHQEEKKSCKTNEAAVNNNELPVKVVKYGGGIGHRKDFAKMMG